MAQKKIGNESNEAGICGELVTTLKRLFLLMRDRGMNFQFMNLRHNTRFEGQPVPYVLRPAELAGVKVERGKVVIQSDDAIFRIYEMPKNSILETLSELLNWAKEKIDRLIAGMQDDRKTVVAPHTIQFFSAAR